MKINYWGLFAFSLVCVLMLALTGNYVFSVPADGFFLAACIPIAGKNGWVSN